MWAPEESTISHSTASACTRTIKSQTVASMCLNVCLGEKVAEYVRQSENPTHEWTFYVTSVCSVLFLIGLQVQNSTCSWTSKPADSYFCLILRSLNKTHYHGRCFFGFLKLNFDSYTNTGCKTAMLGHETCHSPIQSPVAPVLHVAAVLFTWLCVDD